MIIDKASPDRQHPQDVTFQLIDSRRNADSFIDISEQMPVFNADVRQMSQIFRFWIMKKVKNSFSVRSA